MKIKIIFSILLLLGSLISIQAQRRSKLPRVKVQAEKPIELPAQNVATDEKKPITEAAFGEEITSQPLANDQAVVQSSLVSTEENAPVVFTAKKKAETPRNNSAFKKEHRRLFHQLFSSDDRTILKPAQTSGPGMVIGIIAFACGLVSGFLIIG